MRPSDRIELQDRTRDALGLPVGTTIVATGHQSLLWHPGILAKYFAVERLLAERDVAGANLVVDQHAGGWNSYEIPVRTADGRLAVRRIELTAARDDVPMAAHAAFEPIEPPDVGNAALPSVARGVERIHAAIASHRHAPNAAIQMALALRDLKSRWVRPLPLVTAGDLLSSPFGRALLEEMVRDPVRAAGCYNQAVAATPEARIGPLVIRDDYVEMPLWRLRDDGRRMHAWDNDVEAWLEDPERAPKLMPRALTLTALVRLAMCDLFVHGTGGATYDHAMERWVESWLGLTPAPVDVATATLTLPLGDGVTRDLETVRHRFRRQYHDPDGDSKRAYLSAIATAPRRSRERRRLFVEMHEELAKLRETHRAQLDETQRALDTALRDRDEHPIVERRTWPFPLYPDEMIETLSSSDR